ncbi:FeoB-associated Cys-rich membrane protein [Mucilaginibacter daejeonensis]|uniref:FeoB-associated Cys-rich membrane protein n=1 Tax=Mucilaginibacter daejeonensis TaxID=398049 RepID=UPI001D172B08|nr:FeoB-associated Cys-rich membrane protein [Mucilaginibacter daejeonensis]UEG52886.1 FeoB-associated Cys-rich membrane protein [Mucilaginibacter daejeonensis]
MSFQTIAIILLFAAAIFYVGRMLYKSLYVKKGCGSNCKCGVDFSNIDVNKPRS